MFTQYTAFLGEVISIFSHRHCPLVYMVPILHVWNATFGAGCVNNGLGLLSSNSNAMLDDLSTLSLSSFLHLCILHCKDLVSMYMRLWFAEITEPSLH